MKNILASFSLAVTVGGVPLAMAGTGEMVEVLAPEYSTSAIHTVGDSYPTGVGLCQYSEVPYTPPGVMDGIGAYEKNAWTVRVLVNHELGYTDGYPYSVSDGSGGTFSLTGARVSYFDISKWSRKIIGAGPAYDAIRDAYGNVATDTGVLANNHSGFNRFCSSHLIEPMQFGDSGLADRIYFTGEENGGGSSPVSGAEWALDPASGSIWHVPAMGRGAWENVTEIDTGAADKVAFILSDDTSPFDADGDSMSEAAPLYLYVGVKNSAGDFLAQNGLRGGKLYVWVSKTGETLPSQFLAAGSSLAGQWVEIDNAPTGTPSENGSTGFDEYGYPTQRTLWTRAESLGAFGFSRPEDVATNPYDGSMAVLASTGVDTYDVLPSGNGADTFGTLYLIDTDFSALGDALPRTIPATIGILYDGDADPARALRSPDNLDWADDGLIYVQEDKAEDDTLLGEPLFGPGAVNPNEAQIARIDPNTGAVTAIAQIDRSVVLDPTTVGTPVDDAAGRTGAWETSGILDVSDLFGESGGTLFLFDVQAHGIGDQNRFNADSLITDNNLKEGGQLAFLKRVVPCPKHPKDSRRASRLERKVVKVERQIRKAERHGNGEKVHRLKLLLKRLKSRLQRL